MWRLNIPLYGEADAGRIWNRTLGKQLRHVQHFKQSQYDPCYFYKFGEGGQRLSVLMYVDDGYALTNAKTFADRELAVLDAKFKLTRKDANFFLGNNVRVWDA